MWQYEKKLEYPVNIKNPNPALAKVIITQFGGPDGELGAAMRYLSQRYTAPCNEVKAILSDIGSEASEMAFSEASVFLGDPLCGSPAFNKAPVTPFATVKLHLCGSIFK